MTEDKGPPTPLPPAAQSPYPAHPAPHSHPASTARANGVSDRTSGTKALEPAGKDPRHGSSTLTIIGGVVGIGALVALAWPLIRAPRPPKRKNKAKRKK